MGLDDFTSGSTSDVASSSSRGGGRSTSTRWTTKLSFSTPYVVVAEDRQGNLYRHKDTLAVLKDADDWRRLDDHPNRELRVLFKVSTMDAWLRFCNLCQDQFGIYPNEVFEDDPKRLGELKERVNYPPASKPDLSRTCQVCGASEADDTCVVLEMRLEKHRRLAVCASHTVEELAEEGFLQ